MTGAWSLSNIWPYLESDKDRMNALNSFISTVIAVYVAQGWNKFQNSTILEMFFSLLGCPKMPQNPLQSGQK